MVFYEGMLADGVGEVKAKVMYGAVYHFGPRWGSVVSREDPETGIHTEVFVEPEGRSLSENDFEKLRSEIKSKNLTLEQIQNFHP